MIRCRSWRADLHSQTGVIAMAALRKATALPFFSSFLTWLNAMREASSMQTWTNSQPSPLLHFHRLLWPLRWPVMRWPILSFFDVDVDQIARVVPFVAAHRRGRVQSAEFVQTLTLQNTADRGR